jgi:hypothetical protein
MSFSQIYWAFDCTFFFFFKKIRFEHARDYKAEVKPLEDMYMVVSTSNAAYYVDMSTKISLSKAPVVSFPQFFSRHFFFFC